VSVGRRNYTVIPKQTIASGAFARVALDVSNWCDFTLQQVQESAAGGAGVARVYGSALPFGDPRLVDLDPATNVHWELDPTVSWGNPGTVAARSARASDNTWSTILVEIAATAPNPQPDIAVYAFAKER
jgi:hypothetical protein